MRHLILAFFLGAYSLSFGQIDTLQSGFGGVVVISGLNQLDSLTWEVTVSSSNWKGAWNPSANAEFSFTEISASDNFFVNCTVFRVNLIDDPVPGVIKVLTIERPAGIGNDPIVGLNAAIFDRTSVQRLPRINRAITEPGEIGLSREDYECLMNDLVTRVEANTADAVRRDSTFLINFVSDTSLLSPLQGDRFINASRDTLGMFDSGSWRFFLGLSELPDSIVYAYELDSSLTVLTGYIDSVDVAILTAIGDSLDALTTNLTDPYIPYWDGSAFQDSPAQVNGNGLWFTPTTAPANQEGTFYANDADNRPHYMDGVTDNQLAYVSDLITSSLTPTYIPYAVTADSLADSPMYNDLGNDMIQITSGLRFNSDDNFNPVVSAITLEGDIRYNQLYNTHVAAEDNTWKELYPRDDQSDPDGNIMVWNGQFWQETGFSTAANANILFLTPVTELRLSGGTDIEWNANNNGIRQNSTVMEFYVNTNQDFRWRHGGEGATQVMFLDGGADPKLGIGSNHTPAYTLSIGETDGMKHAVGTTAQRPAGVDGVMRFNSDLSRYEGYDDAQWNSFAYLSDITAPALTTTYVGYGVGGVLGGEASFTYDATTDALNTGQAFFDTKIKVGNDVDQSLGLIHIDRASSWTTGGLLTIGRTLSAATGTLSGWNYPTVFVRSDYTETNAASVSEVTAAKFNVYDNGTSNKIGGLFTSSTNTQNTQANYIGLIGHSQASNTGGGIFLSQDQTHIGIMGIATTMTGTFNHQTNKHMYQVGGRFESRAPITSYSAADANDSLYRIALDVVVPNIVTAAQIGAGSTDDWYLYEAGIRVNMPNSDNAWSDKVYAVHVLSGKTLLEDSLQVNGAVNIDLDDKDMTIDISGDTTDSNTIRIIDATGDISGWKAADATGDAILVTDLIQTTDNTSVFLYNEADVNFFGNTLDSTEIQGDRLFFDIGTIAEDNTETRVLTHDSGTDEVQYRTINESYAGYESSSTDANGDVTVTIGSTMPDATYVAMVQPEDASGNEITVVVTAKTTTTFTVRLFNAGTAINTTAVTFGWRVENY